MSSTNSQTDSKQSQLMTPDTEKFRRASYGIPSSIFMGPTRVAINVTPTRTKFVLPMGNFASNNRAQILPPLMRTLDQSNGFNITTTASQAAHPHPHGAIGDRPVPYVREPVNITASQRTAALPTSQQTVGIPTTKKVVSTPAAQTQCLMPMRQPTTPPMAAVLDAVHSHVSSVPTDKSGAPVYFKPMFSLMAPGAEYHPIPSEMGAPNRMGTPRMLFTNPAIVRAIQAGTSDVDRLAAGFSPWYRGDINLRNNQSENIPDDQNCSLFIVNLPPTLTTHELLGAIHKMGPSGRIYAVHINAPELMRGHPGCAAKVVFFKRDVAHAFYMKCTSDDPQSPGLRVNGHPARVMWNRIKTSERQHLSESNASRVLLIAGSPEFVNPRTLTDFFNTKLQFQVDRIITHVRGTPYGEDAVVEYRFGSFRCQAQAAKMALTRELPHIRCFFGMDPLEPHAWTPLEYYHFENGF